MGDVILTMKDIDKAFPGMNTRKGLINILHC